ncbi:DinB family protein [Chitinophaga agrisoli]|uniref:DinB family protein n=1 Tax=Chitinophaga agrisoli TaxID=2607653 RepID=UPI001FE76CCE|nr:DinB family protein [Chitinophaga agrisoli]
MLRLRNEISAYKNEQQLWHVEKEIPNSAGNLCLHLIGNLKGFIGTHIGQTGYVRDRPLEFSLKNIPREELLKHIDETAVDVDAALSALTEAQLDEEYPLVVFEEKMTIGFFLTHLLAHLSYHLGQINYHRRLLDL